jgi:hypothetical protein
MPADSWLVHGDDRNLHWRRLGGCSEAWNERCSEASREYPPDFLSDIKDLKTRDGAKIGCLILALKPANRRLVSTKVSRDFDVIRPVSGPVPDCFLSILQIFCTRLLRR